MRKAGFMLMTAFGLLGPVCGFAQSSGDWLPQSGVKSPYSPLAVPTTLKPLALSLTELLNKGFKVISTTDYSGQGVLLTVEGRSLVTQKLVYPDFPNVSCGISQLCGNGMPERMKRNFSR